MDRKKALVGLLITGFLLGIIEAMSGIHFFRLAEPLKETMTFVVINTVVELQLMFIVWIGLSFLGYVIKKVFHRAIKPFFLVGVLVLLYCIAAIGTQVRDSFPGPDGNGLAGPNGARNVVLIVVDTLRQDRLGCYGHPLIKTPTLDRFSRRGDLFSQVVCPIPITAPSHLSLFSGLYPYEHGGRYNGMSVSSEKPLLAELLQKTGYFTVAFVASAAVDGSVTGLSRGFDYYDDRFFFYHYPQRLVQSFPIRFLTQVLQLKSAEIRAPELNKRVKAYLGQAVSRAPFFLWLHYYDPHIPYIPLPPYDRMYDLDYEGSYGGDFRTIMDIHMGDLKVSARDLAHIASLYDGEVSAVDRSLEDIFRSLFSEYSDLMDRTTVIVTSDHGESLTEHNYFFFHAERLYDPSLLVPLIFRRPSTHTTLEIHQDQVLTLDLYSTILNGVGFQCGPQPHSRDLFDEAGLNGKSGKELRYALSENGDRLFLGPGNQELHLDQKSFSLRTETMKYIRFPSGEEEMFDLLNDPLELDPVLGSSEQKEIFRNVFEACAPALQSNAQGFGAIDPETIRQLRTLGYVHD